MKVRGQHGTLGVLVLVHVTLMQKEIGPEVSQMGQLHAQEIQLTQEVVQVLSLNFRYHEQHLTCHLFNCKLKACGRHGIRGALALAFVTVMQNGTEQETSLEVINLALEMKRKRETAQVQPILS